MPPNIVPGWPPQRGQRIEQGLFHTYSIGPAAGGPGGGTPGNGNPQMVDPQQQKMRIPPGAGGPGPGVEGGAPFGGMVAGMGAAVFNGLGAGTGAMLPGIGMGQGGFSAAATAPDPTPAGIRIIDSGVWELTVPMGVPPMVFFQQPDVAPVPGADSRYASGPNVKMALPFGNPPDEFGWSDFGTGALSTQTAEQVKPLTDEEKAWTNSDFGELLLAIADTDSEIMGQKLRDDLRRLKEILDEVKRGGGLWWGRGGLFASTAGVYSLGQTIGERNVILLNWLFGERRPAPCTARYMTLLSVIVNELHTSGSRSIAGTKAGTERASNRASRLVLEALKEALTKAAQRPRSPGTSRIREWIASHRPCDVSSEDGQRNLNSAIDAALRGVALSDEIEGQ